MSGRRSSSCDGSIIGTSGGVGSAAFFESSSADGGRPSSTAIACASWARVDRVSSSCACAERSCVCACSTSLRAATPLW